MRTLLAIVLTLVFALPIAVLAIAVAVVDRRFDASVIDAQLGLTP